jgi:tripartite-type tricarboxylate transporter receptor subunit TctC
MVTMKHMSAKSVSTILCATLLSFAAITAGCAPSQAQTSDLFARKNLNILVGVEAGGTADTVVRKFAIHLRKHLSGSPSVVVQNMAGAGSNLVFNYYAEKGAPDGLTIVYSSYQALAQALGDASLRARFEDFEFLGGISDTRVTYGRTDMIPGGLKTPADIMKADKAVAGSFSNTDFEGTLSHLSLDVLGVSHRMISGYRGGSDIFLAMQRGEVHLHNTSIGTFRTRSANFIKAGDGMGIYYLAAQNPDGKFERNALITEMPAFPDLYQQIHGKPPAGKQWDALNWLTLQTGELSYAAFALRGTKPEMLAALREAFSRTAADPEFIADSVATNGIPYRFVPVEKGDSIIRALSSVSPDILDTLRASMKR